MKSAHLLLLVAIALLAGCTRHEPPPDTTAALPPAKVRVVTARIESLPAFTETTGVIRPINRAVLAAKVMGAIEELPIALGQRVHAGDLLVKIAAGEISARVLQARSQLNVARRDLERERDLLGKGASTADMVKGLEDRFAMTEAMVREAEAMLDYTTLRAPFDGVVARKFANAGDLAAPGQPLVEIEETESFQVEAALPDSLAARLAPRIPLSVTVPVANASFTGQLAELSSAADPTAHTVLAKIDVPHDAAVRSGQFARVQVPGAPVPTLLVPTAAVTRYGQLERIFVADTENRAVLRLVKAGTTHGDRTEILAGLDDGDRVVLDAPVTLTEGQPLVVAQQ